MVTEDIPADTEVNEEDNLTLQEREHKKKVEALHRRLEAGWRRA